jgi:hypothetical protein
MSLSLHSRYIDETLTTSERDAERASLLLDRYGIFGESVVSVARA